MIDAIGQKTTYLVSDRDLVTDESSDEVGEKHDRYDESGDLVESVDARGIATDYVRDTIGRLVRIDLPGETLDTIVGYGDAKVPARATAIVRGGTSLAYAYDRYGRLVTEGAVGYGYDKNGRLAEIDYPNGVRASYGFDFADRPESLTLSVPGQASRTIATDASYFANGPLRALHLGNGIDELRGYDERYLPLGIEAARGGSTLLDWRYETDAVGNIQKITDALDGSRSRLYGYQDVAYFLNHATGPWGELAWEYDPLGNRVAETRDGGRTSYARSKRTVAGADGSSHATKRLGLRRGSQSGPPTAARWRLDWRRESAPPWRSRGSSARLRERLDWGAVLADRASLRPGRRHHRPETRGESRRSCRGGSP